MAFQALVLVCGIFILWHHQK